MININHRSLGSLSYSSIVLNDIISDADGTLFNVILQLEIPLKNTFLQCMKYSQGVLLDTKTIINLFAFDSLHS